MQQNAGLLTQHVSSISMPIFSSTIVVRVTSSVQHTQLTALHYTTQTAYRFGHQKADTHDCTPEDGHTNARNMLCQYTSILPHLVGFYHT
jgi:hypothetical protein